MGRILILFGICSFSLTLISNYFDIVLQIEDKKETWKEFCTHRNGCSPDNGASGVWRQKIFYMAPRVACWCLFRHWTTTESVCNQPPCCDRSICPSASKSCCATHHLLTSNLLILLHFFLLLYTSSSSTFCYTLAYSLPFYPSLSLSLLIYMPRLFCLLPSISTLLR